MKPNKNKEVLNLVAQHKLTKAEAAKAMGFSRQGFRNKELLLRDNKFNEANLKKLKEYLGL